ncbi:MAG TPA: Glu-tRNA(Gln) amidotransferase subunit GatD [Thermoanaerobaculia bacterium]|nr:Glu-tRNA(Gln) amidotransferase subunit GatD [Thermoanaerobaculia bacterium]HUM30948.1 Glu-tRNA(Gln) amidotransferase subunit GatD [Thermoanaerobaculia bacterium]HXK69392.1 Glu-tRNA(Gln) amidotransferase subunit GatD [Thermoanaerobaculia bacterium]
MNDEQYKGYRGRTREVLERFGARVWGDVELESDGCTFHGIILPRSETADADHVVLKLHSGYNVGVHADRIRDIREVGYKKAHYQIPESEFPRDDSKPDVTLLGTGGTIASRLDYTTGAVIPAFSPGELYGAVPELADIANLTTRKLFGIFSEDMGPHQWKTLAAEIGVEFEKGASGIVIGHGTDTMHYTAAILSFMVQDPPGPIVLVGSQRSSDRPSSDAARNLINAVHTAAYSDIAEVMVCMFGPTSDEFDLLHRGTRVRKMHSSTRSTFRTLSARPLATVSPGKIRTIEENYRTRDMARKPRINPAFEEKVSLVTYYPNMKGDIIDALVDNGYKGIIIGGTGLGHVNRLLFPSIRNAVQRGVHVYMTVQTLWGYVHMNVYDTGRYLLDLGVIPAGNMLPEVAYVKLGWALGQSSDPEEVRKIMLTSISHEITEREPYDGYIVLQGGLPEVDEFLKGHLL